MARKTKKERELEAFCKALRTIHGRAQVGVEELLKELRWTNRTLAGLLRPGSRHEHGEPYDTEFCGWCSNIRTWRWRKNLLTTCLPHARMIEADVSRMAGEMSQTMLWETVKVYYPLMRRALVREIWRARRRGKEV